ncbi:MAG: anaerobic ribonucleoside-triphosphate reductase activating protein [Ruminococcus sp.]|jgi:anaerobic ribonucleoside-triphosphate reductase activating protein|nr:anaerobic ribonucleoside-triphosphate reductase activating protein [Ruminococcus sp.]
MKNYSPDEKIRISGVTNDSIVDGPGFRYVIFAQGCDMHCEGCHNPQTWDKNGGYEISFGEIMESIRANPLLDGVTLSGGEPFLQAEKFASLCNEIKAKTPLNIISYSGYTYEQIISNPTYKELLNTLDYLIDGSFKLEEQSYELQFMGSKNQRFIDVKASLAKGSVIEKIF